MRLAQLDEVDRTLADAVNGRPGALVAVGERGAGKSWIVDAAAAMAADRGMRVLATRGRADDRELAFGALQTLLRPIERHIDELVPEHADDIRGALSFRASAVDPLQVRVGVFRLLCAASEASPLCIVVDDADLIDRATADVLSFVLGRLGADPIASIITARSPAATPIAAVAVNTSTMILQPFSDTELTELLATHGLAANPAAECARVARGNPGMAVALAAGLTPAQRSGTSRLPAMLRPDAAVLAQHQVALAHLDDHTCRALVVVAADDMGEVRAVRSALAALGEPAGTLDEAEREGLIEIDGPQVRFVDPWLRPAAYYLVAPASRRAAHRALAESYAAPHQAGARAWHLAAAADGPSDAVAEALAMVASDAARRGGTTSAALTLLRAADFAESPPFRQRLLLLALEHWVDSHDLDAAGELAARLDVSDDEAAIAVAEVAALRGVTPTVADPPIGTEAGRWARRRALRQRREALARGGLHADLGALATDVFPAHAQLCLALGHRHAGDLTRSRDTLVLVEALLTPSCTVLRDAVCLAHADLDILVGRFDDARQRLAAVSDTADTWLRRQARWLTERLACADGDSRSSPWQLGSAVEAAEPPLAALRNAINAGVTDNRSDVVDDACAEALRLSLPVEAAEAQVALAELSRRVGHVNADGAARSALSALWKANVRCWDQRLTISSAPSGSEPARPAAVKTVDTAMMQLSQAELRVVEAVASGMTNREAAAALFLSVKTIDFHLQQIYRKLGVRSRTELAVRVAGQERGVS